MISPALLLSSSTSRTSSVFRSSRSLASGHLNASTGCLTLTESSCGADSSRSVDDLTDTDDDESSLRSRRLQKHRHDPDNTSRNSEADTVESEQSSTRLSCVSREACCNMGEVGVDIEFVVPMSKPDRYGQQHPIENPMLIAVKLVDFDFEIKQMPNDDKIVLLLAQQKCPALLTDAFKLMFLRCECFQVQKAAKRYTKYWDKRLEVFGPFRAFQPITLEYMTQEDMIPIQLGAMQVVRRQKTAATTSNKPESSDDDDERDFLYLDPSKLEPTRYTRESGCRALWYFFHSLLEDEQVQKKGLIAVNYCANVTTRNRDPRFMRMVFNSFFGCLPLRLSAYHTCHAPTLVRCVMALLTPLVGKRLRERILMHVGSYDDVMNRMERQYNIPRSLIPTDMGGSYQLDMDMNNAWLAQQASTDSTRQQRSSYHV